MLQVCDCAAYTGPFQKHYFKYREDSPKMAPKECQNMLEEILCMCCVHVPAQVRFVLYVDFYTMHGTCNIKIEQIQTLLNIYEVVHTVTTVLQIVK